MDQKTFKLSGKPGGVTIVAGIDVHKHKLQVFVLGRIDRENRPLGLQVFENNTVGKKELCNYLAKYYPDEIVMEKTGKLSDSVLDAIQKHHGWKMGIPRVSVVPPDSIKRFIGEPHTDRRSAHDLARLGMTGLLKTTYIPCLAAEQLRELTREASKYTTQSTAIINTIKDKLSGKGYTLPDFSVTNTWGLNFLRLLLLDGIDGNIVKIYDLIENGHVMIHDASKKAILDRKSTYLKYAHLNLSKYDMYYLQRQLTALDMIESLKALNTTQIEHLIRNTPLLKEHVKQIENIPGISPFGAAVIVAEVDDMARFRTCNKFLLYCGRAIAPDSSGEHEGKPHMTVRCNHHLKTIFRQAGFAACFNLRDENDVRKYATRQLSKHPKDSMIACANTSAKIAKIVYKVLHDGVSYDPLHETSSKAEKTMLGKKQTDFVLKEARKRASRFQKFTRSIIEDLPEGPLKKTLVTVNEIFDRAKG